MRIIVYLPLLEFTASVAQPRVTAKSEFSVTRGKGTGHHATSTSSEVRVTKTLLLVSTVFLVLNLPAHAIRCYQLVQVSNLFIFTDTSQLFKDFLTLLLNFVYSFPSPFNHLVVSVFCVVFLLLRNLIDSDYIRVRFYLHARYYMEIKNP